jgi:CubicO group peptidase (beta-lactamase class C family)
LHSVRLLAAASLFVVAAGVPAVEAQTLTFSLFERYLDSLREQAGIPGLSAAIVQDNSVVWERGLGRQDVEGNVPATPDTPYYIGDVSQTMGAALALRKCLEEDSLELTDRVTRWVPEYPDAVATVANLLTHTTNSGEFQYSLDRFAGLTPVIVECADEPYRHLLHREVFDRFGMQSSVPGSSFTGAASPGAMQFDSGTSSRFADVVRRTALSYRLSSGRVVRSDVSPPALSASTGVLSTVRDLARFDIALQTGALIDGPTLQTSWTQAQVQGRAVPTGLGWFVQNYNGEPLVWSFGLIRDGYSALVLKLPRRKLTLIALANSDAMTSGYNLHNGDVTASPFATLFLRFFVP